MIETLTPEQEAFLPVCRDKWLKIGLSTEKCDREKAEAAVKDAYAEAGLTPPRLFVWCDSPLSLVLTDTILRASVSDSVRNSVWDFVRDFVRDSVRTSVRTSVRDSVSDSVRTSVWDSVWDSVRTSVRTSVWDSVSNSVWASVWDSVRTSVWDSVWDSVRDCVYGAHDAHSLGFYDCFATFGIDECNKLKPLMELAENCGWWIPRQDVCFLSEKPTICKLENGVIHSEKGPAIAYADGFSIWAINGIRVDEQIVMNPKTQTLDQIREEDNEDVKRIRIARYGWQQFLEEINAKVVDVSIGQWAESLMECSDGIKVLCTVDPATNPDTGRQVCFLEVDPSCETCEQAQRYLLAPEIAFGRYGVSSSKIKSYPIVRA